MAANADSSESDPCIDRQSAGESCASSASVDGPSGATDRTVDHTPETLYLVRIAVLEAKVATLERRLDAREADLQHVVDRYERVLQGRDACRDEPLVSDEFDTATATGDDRAGEDRPRSAGALDRLRGLLG